MRFKMVLEDSCCSRMQAAVEQTNIVVFFQKDEVTVYIPQADGRGNMKIAYCPFCGQKVAVKHPVTNRKV